MNKHLTPSEIRQLPVTERLQLIEEIWDSLDGETDELPMPEWHCAEIDKRLDALNQGTSTGSTWNEVRRRITGKP
jgi:putative addiction module component (TIGR02574 family)